MDNIGRNVFDLSHDRKLSLQMGQLVPVYLEEILPGDHFRVNTSIVIRFNALLAPMMHKVDAFIHYYWVPKRVVWADFEKFITGGEAGNDATAMPYISIAGPIAEGSLEDHLGLPIYYSGTPKVPTAFVNPIQVDACPFRVYNLIYNHWYRNRLLQTAIAISTGNGADSTTAHALLYRNWEKDYFTGAKNAAQLGTAVTLPLGSSAPIIVQSAANPAIAKRQSSGTPATGGADITVTDNGALYSTTDATSVFIDPNGSLAADLSNATASTINLIRQAFQTQKWQEKNMLEVQGLYVNLVKAFFQVRLDDYRAQRPVYLGGLRTPVVVSEVLQTSETSANSPQGNMAGHAFSAENSQGFEQSFQEHGYVMGLLSIMPRTCYQQGLHRMWTRTSKLLYYWPQFAHLGLQEILSREVYCDGDTGDTGIFGYNGRYDEFRFKESSVHGAFKGALDYWHLARKFTSRPTLVSGFVTADPDDRIFAVTDTDTIFCHVYHNVKAVRPLPLVGEPGFVDH